MEIINFRPNQATIIHTSWIYTYIYTYNDAVQQIPFGSLPRCNRANTPYYNYYYAIIIRVCLGCYDDIGSRTNNWNCSWLQWYWPVNGVYNNINEWRLCWLGIWPSSKPRSFAVLAFQLFIPAQPQSQTEDDLGVNGANYCWATLGFVIHYIQELDHTIDCMPAPP